MNNFLEDMEEAYKVIRENAPASVQNPMKAQGAINNYTTQYQQNNPTKAIQPTQNANLTSNLNSADPKQQMMDIYVRLDNLEGKMTLISRKLGI